MARRTSRYREMERYLTWGILADLVLFVLYLVTAGMGIIWAKVVLAIITIVLALLILFYLYLTRELLRRRSLWMTLASAAITLCVLFSLILNFPRPRYQLPEAAPPIAVTAPVSTQP